MIKLKPHSCPICGKMLERKHIRKTKYCKRYDYYIHPNNECILAHINDVLPLTLFDNDVDDWNRRAE